MSERQEPTGVTRIDAPKSHAVGWMARVQRGKERRSEFFADKDCGGPAEAKEEALRQVAQWRTQMPPAATSHRGVRTKRNKSGEVNLSKRVQKTAGGTYEFWTGTWVAMDGRRRLKTFSCHKYTDAGAKRLAQIARDLTTQDMTAILAEYSQRHGGKVPGPSEP